MLLINAFIPILFSSFIIDLFQGYKCRINIKKKSKLIRNCAVDMTLTGQYDKCEVLENELADCVVSWREKMHCRKQSVPSMLVNEG